MATTKNTHPSTLDSPGIDYDGVARRHRHLTGDVFAVAADAGIRSLDAYEQYVGNLLQVGQKVADASQLAWVIGLLGAHADMVSSLSTSYTVVAREVLMNYSGVSRSGPS